MDTVKTIQMFIDHSFDEEAINMIKSCSQCRFFGLSLQLTEDNAFKSELLACYRHLRDHHSFPESPMFNVALEAFLSEENESPENSP